MRYLAPSATQETFLDFLKASYLSSAQGANAAPPPTTQASEQPPPTQGPSSSFVNEAEKLRRQVQELTGNLQTLHIAVQDGFRRFEQRVQAIERFIENASSTSRGAGSDAHGWEFPDED